MHPSVLRGMPRSCPAHVRESLRPAIHARATLNGFRLHPCGGIPWDCLQILDDDREDLPVTVARLQHRHRVRDEGGGDQNGSSWNRWL